MSEGERWVWEGAGGEGRLHSWKIRLTAVNDTPPCFRRIKGLENRENS
jgi:hypothetical protein